MDPQFRPLLEAASRPYAAAGRYAWHFAGTARATFHETSAFALHCPRAASHNGAYVASWAIIGKDGVRRLLFQRARRRAARVRLGEHRREKTRGAGAGNDAPGDARLRRDP